MKKYWQYVQLGFFRKCTYSKYISRYIWYICIYIIKICHTYISPRIIWLSVRCIPAKLMVSAHPACREGNWDTTRIQRRTHMAHTKQVTSRWATNAARKWGWKSREDSKTFGRQHNETHDIVSWAYFTVVMICCYLHLPITCNLFPEPEQNTRPSWVELRSGSHSRDVHLIDVVWNHSVWLVIRRFSVRKNDGKSTRNRLC